jgi:hypothetical protein
MYIHTMTVCHIDDVLKGGRRTCIHAVQGRVVSTRMRLHVYTSATQQSYTLTYHTRSHIDATGFYIYYRYTYLFPVSSYIQADIHTCICMQEDMRTNTHARMHRHSWPHTCARKYCMYGDPYFGQLATLISMELQMDSAVTWRELRS